MIDPKRIFTLLYCVGGIYVFFILWAVLQERVTAEPYVTEDGKHTERFRAITVLNLVQVSALQWCCPGAVLSILSLSATSMLQATCAALAAYVVLKVKRIPDCGTSKMAYFRAALSNTLASPCGCTLGPHAVATVVPLCSPHAHNRCLDQLHVVFVPCHREVVQVGPCVGVQPCHESHPNVCFASWRRCVDFHWFVVSHLRVVRVPSVAYCVCTWYALGIVVFKVYDSHGYEGSSTWATLVGCGLVLANLAFDGYTSATQDGIFRAGAERAKTIAKEKGEPVEKAGNTVTSFHVMYEVNFWAVWVLVLWLLADAALSATPEWVRPWPKLSISCLPWSQLAGRVHRSKLCTCSNTSRRPLLMWSPSASLARLASCSFITALLSSAL